MYKYKNRMIVKLRLTLNDEKKIIKCLKISNA